MRRIRCLTVGKPKNKPLAAAAEHYAKRLSRLVPLTQEAVKDAPGSLSSAERNAREGTKLLAKMGPSDTLICLDEHGPQMTSPQLAERLQTWFEDPGRSPCFVIGGAYGLSPEILERADTLLALGPMTLPHELARVVLLEQLYRGMAILSGHPYHHA